MTEITDKMRHCTKDFGLDISPEHGGVQVLMHIVNISNQPLETFSVKSDQHLNFICL